jgi:predicted nucleotidyltransferase
MKESFLDKEPYRAMLQNVSNERKIIYLTYGGSNAYGTNTENSDIDLRGIALKTKKELLGMSNFEQFLNQETDTTIYAIDKFFNLALNCNPNIIEMLGTKKEHQFLLTKEMETIMSNSKIFLSRQAIHSFGGYATAQLRRLENSIVKDVSQNGREIHIMNTLKSMQEHLQNHYSTYDNSNFEMYVANTNRKDFETEIFVNVNLQGYPLRDFQCIQSEMLSAVNSYDKLNHRNSKKTEDKLDKHCMHLIRLHLMELDILEKQEINTFRVDEHDMLMSIRNGEWSENNYARLYEELNVLNKRIDYAIKHTELPNKPNYKKAEELLVAINLYNI